MNTNNTTASKLNFVLANPESGDVRAILGLTPERVEEILSIIAAKAKEEQYGENIHGQLWGAVSNLPEEAERLFGAFAIGHGIGMSPDSDNPFAGNEQAGNPFEALAALLAAAEQGERNNPLEDANEA